MKLGKPNLTREVRFRTNFEVQPGRVLDIAFLWVRKRRQVSSMIDHRETASGGELITCAFGLSSESTP